MDGSIFIVLALVAAGLVAWAVAGFTRAAFVQVDPVTSEPPPIDPG